MPSSKWAATEIRSGKQTNQLHLFHTSHLITKQPSSHKGKAIAGKRNLLPISCIYLGSVGWLVVQGKASRAKFMIGLGKCSTTELHLNPRLALTLVKPKT